MGIYTDPLFLSHRDGQLEPKKVRSGNSKLFFLTRNGGGGHPDSRLKLLAQQSLNRRLEVWTAGMVTCMPVSGTLRR